MLETATTAPPTAPIGRWHRRVGLAATVGFIAVGLATHPPDQPLEWSAAAVGLTSCVALFFSTRPGPLLSAAIAVAAIAVVGNGHAADLAWFGVCVVGGWCALVTGPRLGIAFLACASLLFGAEWTFTVDPGWGAWTAGTALTVSAALLVRHQIILVEQMRGLQGDLARRERAEERTRIARELHDVIAHSLTVSLLHVSSARLAVEYDPGAAARSLADAERLTRRCLDDVRATVGVLRSPSDDGTALPAPGLGDLPQLVEDLRAAQTRVTLGIDGDPDDVPATTSMTAYRIVQEALTNAARHASGAATHVWVHVGNDQLDLSVDSSGPPGSGSGMGVSNMRQRAEAVGGTCSAGPGGKGWLVTASLPRLTANGSGS